MKISLALNHFQVLASKADNKRERKVLNTFVGLLTDLEGRELAEEQVLLIENKIDELNLKVDTENTSRKLNKKLTTFVNYLKDQLSLVTEGYYTALGITFGVALGLALAPMLERQLGISFNMGLGMISGIVVGHYLDTNAAKENRVLRTKLG
jgi:tetrahydromethanopterin S-methyltransferase subunit B